MMRTVFRFSVYLVSALLRSLSGGYIQGNRRQGNEINQQTVQFSHHRESLTRFYNQQKTRLWNIFLKNSLVCTKFIDQKLESFRIVYHEIIIIKYYSILRGTKVMRKNRLLSFFPFFFHGLRVALKRPKRFESNEILPVSKYYKRRVFEIQFEFRALSTLSSTIHWIISARMEDIETCFLPRLLNGGTGSPFRLPGYQSTIIAKCRRMPWARVLCALRDCARIAWYWWAHLIARLLVLHAHTRIAWSVYTLGRFAHVRIQCRSVDFDDGIGIRGGLRFVVKRIFRAMNTMDVN